MTDAYSWWREALTSKTLPPIVEGKPEAGYFKIRINRDGPFEPVGIFPEHDELAAVRGFSPVRRVAIKTVWPWVARHPISYELYAEACAAGRFPDDVPPLDAAPTVPAVPATSAATALAAADEPSSPVHDERDVATSAPRGLGDNAPPATSYEAVKREIEARAAQARQWLADTKIDSDVLAQQAQNWRDELSALEKKANREREAEKRPHLDANLDIDKRWNPLRQLADDAARAFGRALTAFLDAKQKKQREAAQQQMAAGKRVEEISVAPVKVAGAKRTVALKTVTTCVVVDHTAALAFFADSPEVVELVQKLAQRAARAGLTVPGTKIVSEQVAS